jgi:hypothetical protein
MAIQYVLPPLVYLLWYLVIGLIIAVFAEFGFFYYFMGYIGRSVFGAKGNISIHITEHGSYFIKKDQISSMPGWMIYKIGKIFKYYPVREGTQYIRAKSNPITIVCERGGFATNVHLALYAESLAGNRNDFSPDKGDGKAIYGPTNMKPNRFSDILLGFRRIYLLSLKSRLAPAVQISYDQWKKDNPNGSQSEYRKQVEQLQKNARQHEAIDNELAIIDEIRTGIPRRGSDGRELRPLSEDERWDYIYKVAKAIQTENINILPAEIGGVAVNLQTAAKFFDNIIRPYEILADREDAVQEYKAATKKGENIMKFAIAALIILVGAAIVISVIFHH